jgi:pyruvate kinase
MGARLDPESRPIDRQGVSSTGCNNLEDTLYSFPGRRARTKHGERQMPRRAKIAATLGPACDTPRVLEAMIESGMNVARLNFSHGTFDDHRRRVRRLDRAARRKGRGVTVLADLQGPRFRLGRLEGGTLELRTGDGVELVAGKSTVSRGKVPVTYAGLARDVKRGDRVLIDDGKIELRVERVRGSTVRCDITRGGPISDHKGINLPGSGLSAPALTAKDRKDLKLAVELGADCLAVSFVRRADDVLRARRLLQRAGKAIPVMAKIERPEAIERLDEILEVSNGLLVARGDLGVELPAERVPILQKQIVERANAVGKPVMTATQMLESMRFTPRPTRAEASDVANAVLDGSGCLLLTAETAVGDYPVEAVRMMAQIIVEAEAADRTRVVAPPPGELSVALTTCRAGCRAAFDVGARYIVVFTQSGFSAQQVARFRPTTPILAFTPDPRVARLLNIVWGVEPRKLAGAPTIDRMLASLDRALLKDSSVRAGDVVVVLAGTPVGVSGTTNLMEVRRVGGAS